MKFNKFFLGLAIVALAGILSSCGILKNGGAYSPGITTLTTNADSTVTTNFVATSAPDLAFYKADVAWSLAYSIVDGVFSYEKANRAALFALSPAIKHTLDTYRPQAWAIEERWALARKAYIANPIPANLDTMNTILAQIQSLATAAQAAIAVKSN